MFVDARSSNKLWPNRRIGPVTQPIMDGRRNIVIVGKS